MQKFKLLKNMPKLTPSCIQFDDKEALLNCDAMDGNASDGSNVRSVPANYVSDGILKLSATNSNKSTPLDTTLLTNSSNGSSSMTTKTRTHHRSTSGSGIIKPNTILSLEDRDIVVIDHVDYKESINNESEVIVVEKPHLLQQQQQHPAPHDIDLADLLGQNWPSIAGDSALALNNLTSSSNKSSNNNVGQYVLSSGSTSSTSSGSILNSTTIIERNKSKNPLAHFGQSKVKRITNTSNNLINFDNDGNNDISSEFHSLNMWHMDNFPI